MVIVELIGGLGNQMFQYAIGRYMAEKLQTSLYMDVFGFEKYSLRQYELRNFKIQEQFASKKDLQPFSLSKWQKLLCSVQKLFGKSKDNCSTCVLEKSFNFDPDVLQHTGNLYLSGYWQSEKYFKEITPVLFKEFSSRNQMSSRSMELQERMHRPGSVAIHIRRGDYVSNQKTNQVHGVMPLDYYRKAMNFVAARKDNLTYYVFSDDPGWVRENFIVAENINFIEPSDPSQSYEDMLLMSFCNHNIIANSSFSWWSAWLNRNPDKIVIAPQKWFNKTDIDTADLIPDSWIRL